MQNIQLLELLILSMLSVSARVRELETLTKDKKMKVSECESSCNGVSSLFDKIEEQTKKVENQTKLNTRNLIQQDIRIKKLKNSPVYKQLCNLQ